MKSLALAQVLALASSASASDLLRPRASPTGTSNESYLQSVCQPPVATGAKVIPPCTSDQTIETLCAPNGTSPLALQAHAQCMCGGSFFADWLGCRACLLFHGGLSERELAGYRGVLSAVSAQLCAPGATPTAAFSDLFNSQAPPAVSTGATTSADQKSGDADVGLYYTPSGSQGPGAITGSATAATATAPAATTASAGTKGGTAGGNSAGNTGGAKTTATPTTSHNAAAVTAGADGKGLLLAVAGALAVAL